MLTKDSMLPASRATHDSIIVSYLVFTDVYIIIGSKKLILFSLRGSQEGFLVITPKPEWI